MKRFENEAEKIIKSKLSNYRSFDENSGCIFLKPENKSRFQSSSNIFHLARYRRFEYRWKVIMQWQTAVCTICNKLSRLYIKYASCCLGRCVGKGHVSARATTHPAIPISNRSSVIFQNSAKTIANFNKALVINLWLYRECRLNSCYVA